MELIHEALLREWGLLRQWLAEDREMLAWRQRIERPAAEWHASSSGDPGSRDPDLLLRGRQLAEAEQRLGQRRAELPAHLVAFIQASQELQRREWDRDRRRIRTLTALTATLVVLLLVAITAGVFVKVLADRARDEAGSAKSRELAAVALARADESPDLSLLLSLEALRTAPTDQARDSLLSGLLQPGDFIRLTGHSNIVYGVAFSPDGHRLASASTNLVFTLCRIGLRVHSCPREAPKTTMYTPFDTA